jgi:hypothetical protein
LDGRKEKPDQNADDRDDDEKFDQREAKQPPVRFDGASHKRNPFVRTTRRFSSAPFDRNAKIKRRGTLSLERRLRISENETFDDKATESTQKRAVALK